MRYEISSSKEIPQIAAHSDPNDSLAISLS
jgi:hypothetical protein